MRNKKRILIIFTTIIFVSILFVFLNFTNASDDLIDKVKESIKPKRSN